MLSYKLRVCGCQEVKPRENRKRGSYTERARSCSRSIEISDTYVYIYACIYVAVRQVICTCSLVRNVGGVKC